MAQQKVELRKTRDFSENINDTFVFIRQNFKPLLVSFLGIAGIFILAGSIVSGIYQSKVGGIFEQIFKGTNTRMGNTFELFNEVYFMMIALSGLSMVAMTVCISAYMKVYDTNNGETPTLPEVWQVFKRHFLQAFIYCIPLLLLIIIGAVFCLVPGVYFGVVLMPFVAIMVIEDLGFGKTWKRCFLLIKDNFWMSLGIYLVVYLIYTFSSGIIAAVISVFTMIISYFSTSNNAEIIVIITSILSIFTFVFYIIFYVSVCLNYYSLAEQSDGTGMMRRIESLGGRTNFTHTEEQY